MIERLRSLLLPAFLILMAAGALLWWTGREPAGTASKPGAEAAAGDAAGAAKLTPNQIARLGIRTAVAQPAADAPLGSVPAIVTLPPEARVAVTAPFSGSVVRLYVVPGQAVRKGQPLAQVRSREPLQIGADLSRAEARLGLARASAARASQLAREGIVAGARAEQAQAELRQAATDVAEARRILAQAGASPNGEVTLRAPITGRLAAVNAQTGGPVDAMTAPFVVESAASFMLDLHIPERLAGSVLPGMAISARAPGGGPVVAGTIVSVGPSIDPATRSVPAKARLAAASGLVSGKVMMAEIKGATVDGVAVPSAAITRIGDKDLAFVQTRDGFQKRVVTVAARSAEQAIISAGLRPGERVAVSGISELKNMLGGE